LFPYGDTTRKTKEFPGVAAAAFRPPISADSLRKVGVVSLPLLVMYVVDFVIAWRDALGGQGLTNDTIRRKLAALSSLYA
jgi:hypothetical protein